MTGHLTAVRTPQPADQSDDRETLERLVIVALCSHTLWTHWPKGGRQALATLHPQAFHHGHWRTCYEAITALEADRRPIEIAELADELDRRGHLTAVGGIRRLVELTDAAWTHPGANPVALAELLVDRARREQLTQAATQLATQAHNEGQLDIDQALAHLTPLATTHRNHRIDRIDDIRDEIHARTDRNHTGLTTGFKTLDWHYRVEPGLLTVVSGTPSAGKSSLVDNLVYKLAARHHWTFAVFSAESAPTSRHARRLAALFAGKPADHMTPDQLNQALDLLKNHVEWINSNDDVDVAEVLRCADLIHRRRPIQGLVIDPWNELDHIRPPHVTETQHISASLTRIRRWARRRDVHVWIVAHPTKMQRKTDGTYDTPTLYDVSGSSTWRDKADMGLIVSRDLKAPVSPTAVHVVKVRFADHGRLGTATLAFDPACERFTDPTGAQP